MFAMRNRKGQKKPDITRWRRGGFGILDLAAAISIMASKQARHFSFSTLVCCTSIGASRSGERESRAGEQADKPAWLCANKYYLNINHIFHPRVLTIC